MTVLDKEQRRARNKTMQRANNGDRVTVVANNERHSSVLLHKYFVGRIPHVQEIARGVRSRQSISLRIGAARTTNAFLSYGPPTLCLRYCARLSLAAWPALPTKYFCLCGALPTKCFSSEREQLEHRMTLKALSLRWAEGPPASFIFALCVRHVLFRIPFIGRRPWYRRSSWR